MCWSWLKKWQKYLQTDTPQVKSLDYARNANYQTCSWWWLRTKFKRWIKCQRFFLNQGGFQPVSLRGAISIIFGSQVSWRVHYCKRDEVYFTTLLWQNNRRQNGLILQMLFSELYKIMVNKVTFVGFRGAIAPVAPLDPPLVLIDKSAKSWLA